MIQYAKSRRCGQYSVDRMNLVYCKLSSFSFFFCFPISYLSHVLIFIVWVYIERDCMFPILRTWFRGLPDMRSAVGGWVRMSAIGKGRVF